MKTLPRPKRTWRPWYILNERPICPVCQLPCITKHTRTAEDGKKIQHRYCPQCKKPFKTMYRIGEEAVDTILKTQKSLDEDYSI